MTAHEVFLEFIENELDAERTRKALIRRSGNALAAASGTVAILLSALGIVDTNRHTVWTTVLLLCAIVTYMAAAILGLLAGRSTPSRVANVATLERMRKEHWTDDVATARESVAHVHTLTIQELRSGSNARSRLLDAAQWVQLAAIIGTLPSVILWTWPR
jgi:hypothetical protein